ncbi:hypothetical protein [Lysobacter gummosus]|uniref:hypothetical protein n=1 Tax=Lysobacter gummosus TaxID=262324 RepID=UPI003638B2B6
MGGRHGGSGKMGVDSRHSRAQPCLNMRNDPLRTAAAPSIRHLPTDGRGGA